MKEGPGMTASGPVVQKVSGRKLIIDNFNYTSSKNQSTVVSWVALMITENRIFAGNIETERPPLDKLLRGNSMDLANNAERARQRSDYIELCGHIAVQNIKCQQEVKDVLSDHILHRNSPAMREPL
eukprot:Seg4223.1 transcript_id=Seg4223.1/GoldUCD/mRNA.D3Y31 product="hypothetical protein" protein_id=Seg4223.1/GoldUCD/D3Y31